MRMNLTIENKLNEEVNDGSDCKLVVVMDDWDSGYGDLVRLRDLGYLAFHCM